EYQSFTMYKRVDKKVCPMSTTFSLDYEVRCMIPRDPIEMLLVLPFCEPPFQPRERLSYECLKLLNINPDGFLSKEEEKLFIHIMFLNQDVLAFKDSERGTFKDEYFSPYKIVTIP
ncbi:hypothetical protein B0H17DRAFT_834970, partial [Mycena rosella]